MNEKMSISLDKLPIKRLESIEENGFERYPPTEISEDEKRLALIRRIDFTQTVEKDAKKTKTETVATPWPWQSVVENLQQAHQELSVIMDLINTVEANDAVTVAGMIKPKQLPNEVLADLSISAATKLQCFRHLGKYFKQSAKALEQQVAREARFYGALIRLQQNWKVKRQRLAVSAPGSEGFTIDLSDNSLLDPTALFHPSSISTVRVDHDSAGMLAVQRPPKSCRSICFGFQSSHSSSFKLRKWSKSEMHGSREHLVREAKKEGIGDEDVNRCVKESHSVLREIHRAIFEEQVFDLVNREAFHPSPGVVVTGIRENFLQLGIGEEASVFLCLVPSGQDADQTTDTTDQTRNGEGGILPNDLYEEGMRVTEENHDTHKGHFSGFPNPISCEIYLQQILLENIFLKAKERCSSVSRTQVSGQPSGDGSGLLGHFCMTLAHRIFSNKVLAELENLVNRIPYLHLLSHPTWHSRTSSWSLFMKVPQSILHTGCQTMSLDTRHPKNRVRSQFHTKVVVNDECINVGGEGSPNVVSVFRGSSVDDCLINCYDCDLADIPVILLQQVASQVIRWLHEEALVVGMKASRDFLCLSFELEQGDTLGLVAHVDPDDVQGCISWWMVMEDGLVEEGKVHSDSLNGGSENNRRFLGHLSLEALYSTLMDLVSLCSSSGNH